MNKRFRGKQLTGKWKNKVCSGNYRYWCNLFQINDSTFHGRMRKFNNFQDFVDAYHPIGWKEKEYFLYKSNNNKVRST